MTSTAFLAVLDAGDVLAAVRNLEDAYPRSVLEDLPTDLLERVASVVHLAAYRAGQLDRHVTAALTTAKGRTP